jgi:hypothetical protein
MTAFWPCPACGNEVKATHTDPLGPTPDPYDVLLAIKLSFDYEPLRAIEVPPAVLEHHYPHGERTSWTKRLESDPGVRRVSRHELIG